MSISWLSGVVPAPSLLVLPPAAASLDEAHAAIDLWEHYKRRCLDPAQRLAVEVMMATRADGLWAAASTGREMPRQNGKGDELEVVELWGLVQRAERILHTVHDAVLLATQSQQRLLSVIEGHPDLRRRKLRAWRGTGQQMIEMRNGGIVWYRTRTSGGARGVDEVDRVVIDEAQHAEAEHLAAVTPTLLASVNPQLNAVGTSGIAGKSVWWWQQRKRALDLDPGDFGYVGHTAESVRLLDGRAIQEPIDPSDRELWSYANPALVAGRVGESYFAEQLRRLGPALFAREHLGVWDPELGDAQRVIPVANWDAVCSPSYGPSGRVVVAVDVNPERSWGSLAVSDAAGVVELIDHRPGTGWLVGRAHEVAARWDARVALDPAGPAGSFKSDLGEVIEVGGREFAQACGAFYDDVMEGRARVHTHPSLSAAVAGAQKRPSGDAWAWARKDTSVDVSPLVAVTVARWAAMHLPDLVSASVVSLADHLPDEWDDEE